MMIGTLLNAALVLLGGGIGLLFGARLSERLNKAVISVLGIFTLAFGIYNFFKTQNPLVVLGSLMIGTLLGEWLRIEDGLSNVGGWLEAHVVKEKMNKDSQSSETKAQNSNPSSSKFVRGFLVASLVFCVGPMTILGSIQDGLKGDYNLLAVKSVMDGFAALAFASTLGMGVLFSVVVILLYQGGISLLAAQLAAVISAPMMAEMTAVGGVILIGIAISSLLEIKPIRTANLLPALLFAPLIVAAMDLIK